MTRTQWQTRISWKMKENEQIHLGRILSTSEVVSGLGITCFWGLGLSKSPLGHQNFPIRRRSTVDLNF